MSHFQHYNCLCCPHDSFIIFELCDHCVSDCHAYPFSNSSVSLGHDKSRRMIHGVQVFPTCYKLGEFGPYNSFISTYTSFFVFDPGIDSRLNHFHGGRNDRDIKAVLWRIEHVQWFAFMIKLN